MIKDEIFQYAKNALAGKDLNTVLNDEFRNALLNFFEVKQYRYAEIDKIQLFMEELVERLKEIGYSKLSMAELDEFLDYSEYKDQSQKYTKGIYRGTPVFKKNKFSKLGYEGEDVDISMPLYEDKNLKILHIGTLYYDENSEQIEKYRIVKFPKNDIPMSIFECYSNIDAILMTKDEKYREAVEKQLSKMNVKKINCRGYIGSIVKDEETQEYKTEYDKMALSAVIDYERERQKEGGENR